MGTSLSQGLTTASSGLIWAVGFQGQVGQEKVSRAWSELCTGDGPARRGPQGQQRGGQHVVPAQQSDKTRDGMGW